MSQKRYSGDPKRLYDFMTSFVVVCPKCDLDGEITVPYFLDYKNAIFTCGHCYHSEKAKDRLRYKSTAKANCNQCQASLKIEVADRKSIPNYITVICPECTSANKVKENWESYILKYNNSGTIDPAFGLPLWYQAPIKDEVIWAYNLYHLHEIRDYVSSRLRERTTDRYKMTMVEKLPDFIKMAKNRDEILKAIERMKIK
ncbi:MAG: hypothetical protein WBP08_13195 [Saprospiraceae bacterium]|nr:hypothetical protein [Saprospiraceae bacterium]